MTCSPQVICLLHKLKQISKPKPDPMKRQKPIISIILLMVCLPFYAAINADTSIVVSGAKHKLSVCIPENFDGTKTYPLVVALHYCNGNSNEYRNALKPLCDSMDVIVVCPDNNGSQMTNHNFITASIDTAKSIFHINDSAVYLTGMSCNGFETLRAGLDKVYPFKGIFPWVPWFSSFTSSTFNLDSKIPIVLSVGTADDNYKPILNLFDSLRTHGANVKLVIVPGVGHTLNFSNFSNEMIRCMHYLNDTNVISISPIEDMEMLSNDLPQTVKVKVVHSEGKKLTYRTWSTYSTTLGHPLIEETSSPDSIALVITPIAKKKGNILVILEVAEENGTAIEQLVFKVNIALSPTGISNNLKEYAVNLFPIPASEKIVFTSDHIDYKLTIIDMQGKTILTSSIENNIQELDVSALPKGFYLAVLQNENFCESRKIMVE